MRNSSFNTECGFYLESAEDTFLKLTVRVTGEAAIGVGPLVGCILFGLGWRPHAGRPLNGARRGSLLQAFEGLRMAVAQQLDGVFADASALGAPLAPGGYATPVLAVMGAVALLLGVFAWIRRTRSDPDGHSTSSIPELLLALGLAFAIENNFWVMAAPSAVSLTLFGFLMFSPERQNAFRAFKWPVFLLTAFVALFVPLYAILILFTFFGSRLYYRWRFDFEYPTFKAQ